MSEKNKSRNNEEDEDDSEGDEEEDSKNNDNDTHKNSAAIFALILPQLCAGLFALLESITTFNINKEIEKNKKSNTHENIENEILSQKNNGNKKGNKNEKIDELLKDVLTGLCSTLCTLIDTPVPMNFSLQSHYQSCEKLIILLNSIPIIKNISISCYITVATSLIRQCDNNLNSPQALLSTLPHLCLYKSSQILQKNQFDPFGAEIVDYENVLESFRLIRQCCISCPTVLSIPITISKIENENEIFKTYQSGELFFDCFLFLLKNPNVYQNGCLVRMMCTVLNSFTIGSAKMKYSPSTTSSSSSTSTSFSSSSSSSSTSVLMISGYYKEFKIFFEELLGILLHFGFFSKCEKYLRLYGGFFDTFILLYKECSSIEMNRNVPLSLILEKLCQKIGIEEDKYIENENIKNEKNISSNEMNKIVGCGSEGNSILLFVPSVDPRPQILTALQFMRIVYFNLKYYTESNMVKTSIVKECYLELCNMCRSGILAAKSLNEAETENQREEIISKIKINYKLIIFPT